MTRVARSFTIVFAVLGALLLLAGFVWRATALWLVGIGMLGVGLGGVVADRGFGRRAVPRAEPMPAVQPVAAPPEQAAVTSQQPAAAPAEQSAPAAAVTYESPRAPISTETPDVLAAFAQAAAPAGSVIAASLWLADRPARVVRPVCSVGPRRPGDEPQPESSTVGRAVDSGKAVLEQEFVIHTDTDDLPVWRYAIPLTAGSVAGCAALDVAGASVDAEHLTEVAAVYRGTLTAALALQVAGQESRTMRGLLETSRRFARTVDPQDVIELLLDSALTATGADTASVMLLHDGELRIAAAHGLPSGVIESTRVASGEGIAGWVLATGSSVAVEDASRDASGGRHGVKTALSVPIADEDGIVGVINVGFERFGARVTPTETLALETLGSIGAAAIRNARAHDSTRELYFDALRALAQAVEDGDPFRAGRTDRVLELSSSLARLLDLQVDEVRAVRVASLFHDLGMARIGPALTDSPRVLNTVERTALRLHPHVAAEALAQVPALKAAVPIVLHHHERFDGTGYAGGMTGESIPLGARILAVADAYVALTSDRPYREALDGPAALEEIGRNAGTQFDPRVVMALYELFGAEN